MMVKTSHALMKIKTAHTLADHLNSIPRRDSIRLASLPTSAVRLIGVLLVDGPLTLGELIARRSARSTTSGVLFDLAKASQVGVMFTDGYFSVDEDYRAALEHYRAAVLIVSQMRSDAREILTDVRDGKS